jgi:regulator of sirC expression with transglutaminase-like and TPR domain
MRALASALAGEPGPLDLPALEMASIEFPGLEPQRFLDRLDDMAAELAACTQGMSGPEFVARANTYLFEDIGFRGNERDYYDPRNSCLNWVLEQRTGLPITLSLVYIEVARRIDRPVAGIGLPGHFIVNYDDGAWSTFMDPFNGGKLLSERDCLELAQSIAGDAAADPAALGPVSGRYILVRMLNNLRGAYFRAERFDRAAVVLDLLVEASPDSAIYYKGRAIARIHLRRFREAQSDFERYLTLEPEASDREEVTKQMQAIHRWLGALN